MDQSKKTWDLISIASIPLIMTLGNSMLIPILPMIQAELNVTPFEVSMIITVYSIMAIVMIPIAGYLSDQWGRKKIIIPSLIITALGGLIAGLAAWLYHDPYWLILLGRFVQGFGAAGAAPIVLPLVGDMFNSEEKVSASLGIIETTNTFGKVLSPILGAFLAIYIWFLPFMSIPVFSLLSMLFVFFLVKVPKENNAKKQSFAQFFASLKDIFKREGRWLIAIFLIGSIIMLLLFGLLFYLSTIFEEKYNIEGLNKGFVLAIPLLALSITSFITGRVIGNNKSKMKWIISIGLILGTAAIVVDLFIQSLWLLIVALSIYGIGIGACLPCLDALITEGIEKKVRGTVTSIYSSLRFGGVALGPPLVAILMGISANVLFLTLSGIGLIGVLLALFAIRPKSAKGNGNQYWKKWSTD